MNGAKVSKITRRNWTKKYASDWDKTHKATVSSEGNCCSKCYCFNSFYNPLQRHHIIALSKGGSNTPSNLVILCKKCHNARHTRSLKRR